MKVKKPILLIQDNFGGLDQNQGQNPIVHCRFVGFPPLFGAKNASKSLKMPMFPYKMDTLYILVGGLKVTYSYQVLKNGLEDVTNDVRDCPGGGPCYALVLCWT